MTDADLTPANLYFSKISSRLTRDQIKSFVLELTEEKRRDFMKAIEAGLYLPLLGLELGPGGVPEFYNELRAMDMTATEKAFRELLVI